MKKYVHLTIISVFIFTSAYTQSYQLEITNGYGNGEFLQGDTTDIWARTAVEDKVFDQWKGNGVEYLRLNEWHTTITVPENVNIDNIELEAVFKKLESGSVSGLDSVPLLGEYGGDYDTRFVLNKALFYSIPKNPKGAMFMLHGTNGSAARLVAKYELTQMSKKFVNEGYAVFSFSSNETDLGDQNGDDFIRWNANIQKRDTSENVDLKNVYLIEQYIRNTYDLTDVPFYSLGISNGAIFSDLLAGVFDYKAVAHIVGHGSQKFFKSFDSPSPTLWVMAANDHQENADNAIAYNNYQRLVNRGIETEWYLMEKSPMTPYRMTRSTLGITAAQSNEMYQWLKSNDYLDEDDILDMDELEFEFPWDDFYDGLSFNVSFGKKKQVEDQLKIINADHSAPGDYSNQIIRFFDSFLEPNTTSNKELNRDSFIGFYPNPCKDILIIDTTDDIERVEVYDVDGRLVYRVNNTSSQLDVSHLKEGLHTMKMFTKENAYSNKFIKI